MKTYTVRDQKPAERSSRAHLWSGIAGFLVGALGLYFFPPTADQHAIRTAVHAALEQGCDRGIADLTAVLEQTGRISVRDLTRYKKAVSSCGGSTSKPFHGTARPNDGPSITIPLSGTLQTYLQESRLN